MSVEKRAKYVNYSELSSDDDEVEAVKKQNKTLAKAFATLSLPILQKRCVHKTCIRPSVAIQACLGLFARKPIVQGDVIALLSFDEPTREPLKHAVKLHSAKYQAYNKVAVDALGNHNRSDNGWAANDGGVELVNGEWTARVHPLNNARIEEFKCHENWPITVLVASQKIETGSEIFVSYGNEFDWVHAQSASELRVFQDYNVKNNVEFLEESAEGHQEWVPGCITEKYDMGANEPCEYQIQYLNGLVNAVKRVSALNMKPVSSSSARVRGADTGGSHALSVAPQSGYQQRKAPSTNVQGRIDKNTEGGCSSRKAGRNVAAGSRGRGGGSSSKPAGRNVAAGSRGRGGGSSSKPAGRGRGGGSRSKQAAGSVHQDTVYGPIELSRHIADDDIDIQTYSGYWKLLLQTPSYVNKPDELVVLRESNVELTLADFKTLQANTWVNDAILTWWIKSYWKHSLARLRHVQSTKSNVGVADSFFYEKLKRIHDGKDAAAEYARMDTKMSNWTGMEELTESNWYGRLIMVVNIANAHWFLLCIDFDQVDAQRKAHLTVYDSARNKTTSNEPYVPIISKWLAWHRCEPLSVSINTDCPQQANDYDCGLFVAVNAALLSLRINPEGAYTQKDVSKFRVWLAREIERRANFPAASHDQSGEDEVMEIKPVRPTGLPLSRNMYLLRM